MIDFEFEFQYAEEKQPTLQKVGGSIPAGRCVVLCGGSGCGKSTLLRCINGLIPQFYEGELKGFCRLNGQDTAGIRIGEIGELAASVFQDPRSQFFTVNSSNEVAFGLENHGLPQDKIRRRVDEAFRIFHLERLKDRNVYELSSGERQLISILSAWAMDTDIFLLDEPTANLDFAATQQLKEILLALKKQGKTLLLSEHRLYYLADIAELLLWKMGYGNAKALTVSYVINQVLAAFGSTIIPYAIAAKAMADQMVTDGRQDAILAASQMLQSWVSVALVAGVIVAAFIGAMIGKRIVKKHLAA